MKYYFERRDEFDNVVETGRLNVSFEEEGIRIEQRCATNLDVVARFDKNYVLRSLTAKSLSGSLDLIIDVERRGRRIKVNKQVGGVKDFARYKVPSFFLENNTALFVLPKLDLDQITNKELDFLLPAAPALAKVTLTYLGTEMVGIKQGDFRKCKRFLLSQQIPGAIAQYLLIDEVNKELIKYINRGVTLTLERESE